MSLRAEVPSGGIEKAQGMMSPSEKMQSEERDAEGRLTASQMELSKNRPDVALEQAKKEYERVKNEVENDLGGQVNFITSGLPAHDQGFRYNKRHDDRRYQLGDIYSTIIKEDAIHKVAIFTSSDKEEQRDFNGVVTRKGGSPGTVYYNATIDGVDFVECSTNKSQGADQDVPLLYGKLKRLADAQQDYKRAQRIFDKLTEKATQEVKAEGERYQENAERRTRIEMANKLLHILAVGKNSEQE